jgi:hypothetical protein
VGSTRWSVFDFSPERLSRPGILISFKRFKYGQSSKSACHEVHNPLAALIGGLAPSALLSQGRDLVPLRTAAKNRE